MTPEERAAIHHRLGLAQRQDDEFSDAAFRGAYEIDVPRLLVALEEAETRARKAERLSSVAGDLWNEVENLREHWQDSERASFIQHYIDEYERLALGESSQ